MKTSKLIFSILLLMLLSIAASQDPITVYTIGDSTMCNFDTTQNRPMRGWVQMLPPFFSDKVIIKNCAESGRSSKSFIDLGFWKNVIDQVKSGDYVFIQFAHNDEYYPDTTRFADTLVAYPNNLKKFINETRAKNAIPILFTSICYRHFDEAGNFYPSLQSYSRAAKKVAKEMNVPIIDLNTKTCEMVARYGMEESKKLYMHIAPGVTPIYPDGYEDDTHLCILGATKVAELAVEGMIEENIELSKYLKIVDVDKKYTVIKDFSLGQNYPNPFNPNTKIRFIITEDSHVIFTIYNCTGQPVKRLIDQIIRSGTHEVEWDASGYASGIYFYKLEVKGYSMQRKMLLLK